METLLVRVWEMELYSSGLCLSFVDTENSRLKLHSDGRTVQFGSKLYGEDSANWQQKCHKSLQGREEGFLGILLFICGRGIVNLILKFNWIN